MDDVWKERRRLEKEYARLTALLEELRFEIIALKKKLAEREVVVVKRPPSPPSPPKPKVVKYYTYV